MMEASSAYQRILGIDYGSVRIGLSLSDPLGIIAQPFVALNYNSDFFQQLKKIISQEQVRLVVVGMPLNLKGEKAQKAEEVQKFIEQLKQELTVSVECWDERFTTSIAQRTMREMGMKKKDRQKKDGKVDSMAAALMLQGYLDNKDHSRTKS